MYHYRGTDGIHDVSEMKDFHGYYSHLLPAALCNRLFFACQLTSSNSPHT